MHEVSTARLLMLAFLREFAHVVSVYCFFGRIISLSKFTFTHFDGIRCTEFWVKHYILFLRVCSMHYRFSLKFFLGLSSAIVAQQFCAEC